jgi:hypothetical protein
VTSPAVRVQRLREETAAASHGHPHWQVGYLDTWSGDEPRWVGDGYQGGRVSEADTGEVVVYDEGSPSDEQAAHIARWDPKAAEKVLDVLADALALSAALNEQELFTAGRRLESVALSLLDTLDPEGAEHA